jgi:hypothetical protein
MPNRFFEHNAWKIFAALSVILIVFGIGDVAAGGATYAAGEAVLFNSLTGTTWDELRVADPGAAKLIDSQVRSGGALLLVVGSLSLAVCVTALRRGEPWAWRTMWIWPLWFVLFYVLIWIAQPDPQSGTPVPVISGTIFLAISVVTLVLSFRRYVPADRS